MKKNLNVLSDGLIDYIKDILLKQRRVIVIKIEQYDKVFLKDGHTATVVEILEEDVEYIVDVIKFNIDKFQSI